MHRLAALAAAILLAAVACSGDERRVAAGELPAIVLRPSDVPDLVVFDEGRQSRADQPTGPRQALDRFGREDGWKARYRDPEASSTAPGALVVEARVDLFDDRDGARQELEAHRDELRATAAPLAAPELGDEALAFTFEQPGDPGFRFFVVAWREANVEASVLVQGYEGKITSGDAFALARKQQQHIERALD